MRVVGNELLAYLVAALGTLVVVATAHWIGPPMPGPGVMGYLLSWMGLLSLGAPVMFVVLLVLDVALRDVSRARGVFLAATVAPAVVVAVLAVASSNVSKVAAGYVTWLLLVGLAFGLTARLPQNRVVGL